MSTTRHDSPAGPAAAPITGDSPASRRSGEQLVELAGVSKRYGGRVLALDGVNLNIAPGAVGLLGPNGAGKTTMLRLLLGMLSPTSGHARLLGHDPRGSSARREVRRRVGYMPEGEAELPGSNAVETLATLGELSGLPPRDALARTHEVLDYVGIEEQRYRAVGDWSTGNKQRMKLAQALVHDPELLLLDEPTNGLDPRGRRAMLEIVRGLSRDLGKSLIVCSHVLPDIEATCDSVVLLSKGRVLAHESLQSLIGARERTRLVEVRTGVEMLERSLDLQKVAHERVDDRTLRVRSGEGVAIDVDDVFRAAHACGVTIRRISEERTTLEDAFLERIAAEAGR